MTIIFSVITVGSIARIYLHLALFKPGIFSYALIWIVEAKKLFSEAGEPTILSYYCSDLEVSYLTT